MFEDMDFNNFPENDEYNNQKDQKETAILDAVTRYFGHDFQNGLTFNKPGVRESCTFKDMKKIADLVEEMRSLGKECIDVFGVGGSMILELTARNIFRRTALNLPYGKNAVLAAFENISENDFMVFDGGVISPGTAGSLFKEDDENFETGKGKYRLGNEFVENFENLLKLYNELINLINGNQLLGILYHNFVKDHALFFQSASGSKIYQDPIHNQEFFLENKTLPRGKLDTRFTKIPPLTFKTNYKNFNSRVHLAQICWIVQVVVSPLSCGSFRDELSDRYNPFYFFKNDQTNDSGYFRTFILQDENSRSFEWTNQLQARLKEETKQLSEEYPHECVPLIEIALFCKSVIQCVSYDYGLYYDYRMGESAKKDTNYHTTMSTLLLNLQYGEGVFRNQFVHFPAGFIPDSYDRDRHGGKSYEQVYFKGNQFNIPNDNITIDWTPYLTVNLPKVYSAAFKLIDSYKKMDVSGKMCMALTCTKPAQYKCAGKFCSNKFYCGEKCQKLDWVDHSSDNCCEKAIKKRQ